MDKEDGTSHHQAHRRSCGAPRTNCHGTRVEIEKGEELPFLDKMAHIRRHEAPLDRLRRFVHNTRLDAESKGPTARRYCTSGITACQGICQKNPPVQVNRRGTNSRLYISLGQKKASRESHHIRLMRAIIRDLHAPSRINMHIFFTIQVKIYSFNLLLKQTPLASHYYCLGYITNTI